MYQANLHIGKKQKVGCSDILSPTSYIILGMVVHVSEKCVGVWVN